MTLKELMDEAVRKNANLGQMESEYIVALTDLIGEFESASRDVQYYANYSDSTGDAERARKYYESIRRKLFEKISAKPT